MKNLDKPIVVFFHTWTHEIFFIPLFHSLMKSQISSSVIEVAIVTVTDLLTDHVIKRVTDHVIKRVIKPVTALVTKPVNGIYEFGTFEVDRFP